jgi:hypothetical protein
MSETDPMTAPAGVDTDRQASHQFGGRRRVAVFWCFTACAIIATAGFVWWFFGSIPVALRFIRGERVILEPTRLRAVGLTLDKPVRVSTRIRNYTSKPVRLLGSNVRCTCVVVQALPVTIPPGGTYELIIEARAIAGKPELDETVVVSTNTKEKPQLGVRVSGPRRE